MDAVLVGMDGPPKGELFPLGAGEVSVGRDQANAVAIDDLAASRSHCVIRAAGERFQLIDLESHNGTYVNGVPVRQRLLEHNDQIRVGRSLFLFLRSMPAEIPSDAPIDSGEETRTTVLLTGEQSTYLNAAKLAASLPFSARATRGVQVLLRMSQGLQVARTLEALQCELLELLFDAVPAEHGAIVLCSLSGVDFESAFTRRRGGETNPPLRVDRELSEQVLKDRMARLAEAGPRCLLAAPLMCFARVEGILHLEAGSDAFDQEDLDLVSAVATLAGPAVHNLLHLESLRAENERLRDEIRIEHDMVGESEAMNEIHRFIARVAGADSTILIGGESGTGKDLVARAIHRSSARAGKPFVAINCAALTDTLLEDELFGHERGAFTGAVGMKKGKFEVADGGTLFLDEIGALAPGLQAKLLRVLQHQAFERVGGTRPIQVDVRIVAATNHDLEAAIRAGTFRQDLFFRLNVIPVTVPALRDRREDISLLASYFAEKSSRKVKRKINGISEKAQVLLARYDWPGNIRELENAIERAVVLGASDLILPEDLPEAVLESSTVAAASSAGSTNYNEVVLEAKRQVVRNALERAGGVYTEAAKLLDIHPNYLHRLVNNLRLR